MSFEDKLDDLDAAIFSGDSLESEENRALLREHCERWLRELSSLEGETQ